jgi:hypothetical protein
MLHAILSQAIVQQVLEGLIPSKESPAMRDFRPLPPLLRVARILGLLVPLAGFVAPIALVLTKLFPQWTNDVVRVMVIALNLGLLSGACSLALRTYSTRFRQPDRGPFPLASWQSQVRAIVLAAAPTICALVLAVVISPTARAFEIVFPLSIIGAGVFLAVVLSVNGERHAVD